MLTNGSILSRQGVSGSRGMTPVGDMDMSETGRRLIPQASGYINAVRAAGGTVSPAQENAIEAFLRTGTAENWLPALKRFYLPIWGAASANAIDMVLLGSGTWVGTVTHAAGYAQGDGSTGYFNLGTNPVAMGLSVAGGSSAFAIVQQKDTRSDAREMLGVSGATRRVRLTHGNSTNFNTTLHSASGGTSGRNLTPSGVLVGYRLNNAINVVKRSNALGFQDLGEGVPASALEPPTNQNLTAMAYNGEGVMSLHTDSRLGGFGVSTMGTSAQAASFSAALQTLFETCTGLTLP